MSIEELVALIPPPDQPWHAVGDWAAVEREMGIVFPDDFKELIRRYGSGSFPQGPILYNPLHTRGCRRMQERASAFREMAEAMEIDLPMHPESPGHFPWASDDNGNLFCWWTEGEPDEWPVTLIGHNDEENSDFVEETTTTFLANYLQNEYPELQGGLAFEEKHRRFHPEEF